MNDRADSSTSTTLFGRLRRTPEDQATWRDFVLRYGPLIVGWCRQWHLQEADAEDVTQEVLLRLARCMRTFVYDPAKRFRGYLRTLTHHAWHDFVTSRQQRERASGNSAALALLHELPARDDLARRIEDEFDRELFEKACERVRLRVEPHTWDVFRLRVLQALPGADVAEQLGMKVLTVYGVQRRVQEMITAEVHKLEREEDRA